MLAKDSGERKKFRIPFKAIKKSHRHIVGTGLVGGQLADHNSR